jgi:hypothetical protein
MVDLALLQSVSYIAGASGVCIAAIFYVVNLNETNKNRRVTLTNNLMQSFLSEEGQLRFIELLSMEWRDWEDFKKRYDSTVNPGNYAKRTTLWSTMEILGLQYRTGLLDLRTIYGVCGLWILNSWIKFKPVIEEYRKIDYGSDFFENWEFLANELATIKAGRDPLWKGSRSHLKPEEYDKAFNK